MLIFVSFYNILCHINDDPKREAMHLEVIKPWFWIMIRSKLLQRFLFFYFLETIFSFAQATGGWSAVVQS